MLLSYSSQWDEICCVVGTSRQVSQGIPPKTFPLANSKTKSNHCKMEIKFKRFNEIIKTITVNGNQITAKPLKSQKEPTKSRGSQSNFFDYRINRIHSNAIERLKFD